MFGTFAYVLLLISRETPLPAEELTESQASGMGQWRGRRYRKVPARGEAPVRGKALVWCLATVSSEGQGRSELPSMLMSAEWRTEIGTWVGGRRLSILCQSLGLMSRPS